MRRLFADPLTAGTIPLDAEQSHHARAVLRLRVDDAVELFDRAGAVATGVITRIEDVVMVRVERVDRPAALSATTIAAAVPKGDRADWMIEKLSELGIARFVPLRTARSVVHPEGAKLDRWKRIATESAKQCKRPGLMEIDPLTPLQEFICSIDPRTGVYLAIDGDAPLPSIISGGQLAILVGPEGGWTPEEAQQMRDHGLTPARLGPTILRIETAAIVAAGILAVRNCS